MENKKLGIAKKDLKAGDTLTLVFTNEHIFSEEINCFESITIKDFVK